MRTKVCGNVDGSDEAGTSCGEDHVSGMRIGLVTVIKTTEVTIKPVETGTTAAVGTNVEIDDHETTTVVACGIVTTVTLEGTSDGETATGLDQAAGMMIGVEIGDG